MVIARKSIEFLSVTLRMKVNKYQSLQLVRKKLKTKIESDELRVKSFKVKLSGSPIVHLRSGSGRTMGWNGGSDVRILSFCVPPVDVRKQTKILNTSHFLIGSSLVDGRL